MNTEIFIENERVMFHSCDKVDYRSTEDNINFNFTLMNEIVKKRKELGLPIVANPQYRFNKYSGYFIKNIISKKWYFIQSGNIYYDTFERKYKYSLLYHDSNHSSGLSYLAKMKEIFDFDTLTKEMPEEFKDAVKWNEYTWKMMNDEVFKYLSWDCIRRAEGFEIKHYTDEYPEWNDEENPPKVELSVNPSFKRKYYDSNFNEVAQGLVFLSQNKIDHDKILESWSTK